jgi:NAD(P)-dependent dehydrogenase (short-subunit alcohol dehydrogenase family)
MPWSLEGKRVLVTGGGSGIGRETARLLAQRGAKVALLDLDGDAAAAAAAEIGGGAFGIAVDVRGRAALEAAVVDAAERLGGIDVALANAGLGRGGLLRWQDADEWEAVVEVNLLGVARTARAALPYLVDSRGYLLLTASVAAAVHPPAMSAYSASKAGVEAIGNAVRLEVKHLGVDVGVAYYSWIRTPMVDAADADPVYGGRRHEVRGRFGKTYPVEDAAYATAEGIVARAEYVVYPRWVRRVLTLRTMVNRLGRRDALARVSEVDARAERAARDATPSASG